jgi:hypothetical protein
MPIRPDRTLLAPGLEISRVVTGLWQVADMERNGRLLDRDTAVSAMADYARDGFDSFDMADHYGSAELITGRFLSMQTGTPNPPPPAPTTLTPPPTGVFRIWGAHFAARHGPDARCGRSAAIAVQL